MTWVGIWLKPLVEAVFRETLPYKVVRIGGSDVMVYDVFDTSIYDIVAGGLCRRQTIAAGEFTARKIDAVRCGVMVRDEHARVHGMMLDRETQRAVNRHCERSIRGQLHEVAMLEYHLKGTSMTATYERFINRYNLLNNELNVETLKKERLRKFKDVQNTLINDTLNIIRII